MNYSLKIFLYVFAWIIAWLIFSLIINYGLITTNVYAEGERGQQITFFTMGIISLTGASSLYNEVFTNE